MYGASPARVRVLLRVILKYVATDIFDYSNSSGPSGDRGRWPWCALRWCVPPWLGSTFAPHVQNNGSRGRHHSSSCGRDVGRTSAWVSFKPEWAFNVIAHAKDWEDAETVRRQSGQLEALHSEWSARALGDMWVNQLHSRDPLAKRVRLGGLTKDVLSPTERSGARVCSC